MMELFDSRADLRNETRQGLKTDSLERHHGT